MLRRRTGFEKFNGSQLLGDDEHFQGVLGVKSIGLRVVQGTPTFKEGGSISTSNLLILTGKG